jgi:hypothetical protein
VLAVLLFLPIQKAEYFLREGWTANREPCPTGKSVRVHSFFRLKRTCADAMKMDEQYRIDVVMVGAKLALANEISKGQQEAATEARLQPSDGPANVSAHRKTRGSIAPDGGADVQQPRQMLSMRSSAAFCWLTGSFGFIRLLSDGT